MTSKKCVLSNGLCLLNVKKKTKELVLLSLTDFNNTGKFIFDVVENKLVRPMPELKLKASDLDLIKTFVNDSNKVAEVKAVVPNPQVAAES